LILPPAWAQKIGREDRWLEDEPSLLFRNPREIFRHLAGGSAGFAETTTSVVDDGSILIFAKIEIL